MFVVAVGCVCCFVGFGVIMGYGCGYVGGGLIFFFLPWDVVAT